MQPWGSSLGVLGEGVPSGELDQLLRLVCGQPLPGCSWFSLITWHREVIVLLCLVALPGRWEQTRRRALRPRHSHSVPTESLGWGGGGPDTQNGTRSHGRGAEGREGSSGGSAGSLKQGVDSGEDAGTLGPEAARAQRSSQLHPRQRGCHPEENRAQGWDALGVSLQMQLLCGSSPAARRDHTKPKHSFRREAGSRPRPLACRCGALCRPLLPRGRGRPPPAQQPAPPLAPLPAHAARLPCRPAG